jgi:hypothetical protein
MYRTAGGGVLSRVEGRITCSRIRFATVLPTIPTSERRSPHSPIFKSREACNGKNVPACSQCLFQPRRTGRVLRRNDDCTRKLPLDPLGRPLQPSLPPTEWSTDPALDVADRQGRTQRSESAKSFVIPLSPGNFHLPAYGFCHTAFSLWQTTSTSQWRDLLGALPGIRLSTP